MRILLAAAVLAIAAPASAVTFPGLFNTGVSAGKTATTGNGADIHWSLNGGAAYTGGTNSVFPIGPWLAETSVSRWLTPSGNAADSYDPSADGFYNYTLTFDLTGYKAATASFAGNFAADNSVSAITLNGAPVIGSGGNFNAWTGFSSAGGFVAGVNTLTFTVKNDVLANGNPTGLRVEFTAANAAVPDAATWMTMVAGFGMIGMTVRRRRTAVAA